MILGEHNLNGKSDNPNAKPIIRAVKRMIIHRQYNAQTFENDIALLELHAPIQDEPNVMPICLPSRETDVFDEAIVTGFGKLNFGNKILRVSLVQFMSINSNSYIFSTRKRRIDSQRAAGGPTAHTGQQEVPRNVLGKRSGEEDTRHILVRRYVCQSEYF